MKKSIKIQESKRVVDISNIDFSFELESIVSLHPESDMFWYQLSLFNSNLTFWPYLFNKIISESEYKDFSDAVNYVYEVSKNGDLSEYQTKSICDIAEILVEAKLLREVGAISDHEFIDIFFLVRFKLLQKYILIKKSYLKKEIKEKGLTKNSAQILRAKLATLNEN